MPSRFPGYSLFNLQRCREPLFRPPAEADSLIIQVAYGCPHNGCRFCHMYKGTNYRPRNISDILQEIDLIGRHCPDVKRVFLADADAMALPFSHLAEIMTALNRRFPSLNRINSYANSGSITAKSISELKTLAKLKLNTLYIGLESGDDKILHLVNKPDRVDTIMIRATRMAHISGLKCSVMALLGLGGKMMSNRHARLTAKALNLMQPRLLSILRFIEPPGMPPLYEDYQPLSEYEAVEELRNIMTHLKLDRTVFTANHASNPLPLKGALPRDREQLLQTIQNLLAVGRLDRHGPGYIPAQL